jgi:hypothetical protein
LSRQHNVDDEAGNRLKTGLLTKCVLTAVPNKPATFYSPYGCGWFISVFTRQEATVTLIFGWRLLVVNINLPTTASGQIARRTIGNRRSTQRRRVRLDGRLKPAQEIKRRVAVCWKALGGVSSDALVRARVTELCEIETLVAQLRADALNGEIQGSVIAALFELNRLTNTANRMRDKLGLGAPPSDVVPTIDEILAQDDEDAA